MNDYGGQNQTDIRQHCPLPNTERGRDPTRPVVSLCTKVCILCLCVHVRVHACVMILCCLFFPFRLYWTADSEEADRKWGWEWEGQDMQQRLKSTRKPASHDMHSPSLCSYKYVWKCICVCCVTSILDTPIWHQEQAVWRGKVSSHVSCASAKGLHLNTAQRLQPVASELFRSSPAWEEIPLHTTRWRYSVFIIQRKGNRNCRSTNHCYDKAEFSHHSC